MPTLLTNARKEVRISTNDPEHSVSLFDSNRENIFGETYCVAADILESQIDTFWNQYIKLLTEIKAYQENTPDEHKYKIAKVLKKQYRIYGRETDDNHRTQTLRLYPHEKSKDNEARDITWLQAEELYLAIISQAPAGI